MDQLLREWTPGFGGIERVAHCIATEKNGCVFSLKSRTRDPDTLTVNYKRKSIFSISLGRFLIPFPCSSLRDLLISSRPLLAHLPCPTVLFLTCLAWLFNPRRTIKFYWHSYIDPRPGLQGLLESLYQRVAFNVIKFFPVITTSSVLYDVLESNGQDPSNIKLLPCCLPKELEICYEDLWKKKVDENLPRTTGTIIAIGRLDSYKRFDWLIESFSETKLANKLIIIGEGPDRIKLENLASKLTRVDQCIEFTGLISESSKVKFLAQADVLVLPANKCNEAFGIVQLEAMACGIPSLAFDLPLSGMYWVSHLQELPWSGSPQDLPATLNQLFSESSLYEVSALAARKRYEDCFSFAIWKKTLSTID